MAGGGHGLLVAGPRGGDSRGHGGAGGRQAAGRHLREAFHVKQTQRSGRSLTLKSYMFKSKLTPFVTTTLKEVSTNGMISDRQVDVLGNDVQGDLTVTLHGK